MHNPPHPSLTLRDDVLPALALSVTNAADQLGVSRVALSRVINGRAAISPQLALRLEAWLGVDRGGAARLWLTQQAAYDEWAAQGTQGKAAVHSPGVDAGMRWETAMPSGKTSGVPRGRRGAVIMVAPTLTPAASSASMGQPLHERVTR